MLARGGRRGRRRRAAGGAAAAAGALVDEGGDEVEGWQARVEGSLNEHRVQLGVHLGLTVQDPQGPEVLPTATKARL